MASSGLLPPLPGTPGRPVPDGAPAMSHGDRADGYVSLPPIDVARVPQQNPAVHLLQPVTPDAHDALPPPPVRRTHSPSCSRARTISLLVSLWLYGRSVRAHPRSRGICCHACPSPDHIPLDCACGPHAPARALTRRHPPATSPHIDRPCILRDGRSGVGGGVGRDALLVRVIDLAPLLPTTPPICSMSVHACSCLA